MAMILFVAHQQPLKLFMQGVAAGTGVLDIGSPFRKRLDGHGLPKNSLDLLPALGCHCAEPSICLRSQAFASVHSRRTVAAPIFRTLAVSLSESPWKKCNSTTCAMRGSNTCSRARACFTASGSSG